MLKIMTPISRDLISRFQVGDQIFISGQIYTGRDAVLPKLCKAIKEGTAGNLNINLEGAVIFHTAVSPAGVGPTTSNKLEIEGSIPVLAKAGVRLHLGKGSLSKETIKLLKEAGSIFAITPPVTALFMNNILSKRVAAFPEEGMEALHELEIKDLPAVVAVANGMSVFENGVR